jgi:hypothetical protein
MLPGGGMRIFPLASNDRAWSALVAIESLFDAKGQGRYSLRQANGRHLNENIF